MTKVPTYDHFLGEDDMAKKFPNKGIRLGLRSLIYEDSRNKNRIDFSKPTKIIGSWFQERRRLEC